MAATVSAEIIREKLEKSMNPTHLEITDKSGGCGQNLEVIVVSEVFEGKSLLQRHRLVNECLSKEIESIHSFGQKTYTPSQWSNIQHKS